MTAQFISVEGGEGVGKSTNIAFIEALLQQRQISTCLTREPGGTPLAEEIRELLLKKRHEPVVSDCELLLIFAARAQHVEQKIKPALAKGEWVICDRFVDASFAYQGGGRNLDWQRIEQLEAWALPNFKPNLTVLLEVDPKIGLKRASQRGELDRFEQEKLSFFKRVQAGYLQRAEAEPERFIRIDAGQPLEKVQEELAIKINAFLDRQFNE